MADIGTAYVQIEPTAKGISGKIEQQFGSMGESGGKSFSGGFAKVLGGTGKLIAGSVAVGAAAVTAVGGAFVNASTDVAAYGDNIQKMSQKVGMSTEAYQKWDYVMKISGTEMSNMTTGLKTLTNKLDDAKNGSASAQETFQRLGLSYEDLANMSREDVFAATVTAFQGIEDSADRAALANDLFGRSGQELAPLFNTTAEETKHLMEEVDRLGGVMSDKAVQDSAAFKDSLTALQTSFQGLSRNMLSEFLPDLTKVMDGLTEIFSGNSDKGIGMISEGISNLADHILSAMPEISKVGIEIIKALGDSIIQNLPTLISLAIDVVMQLGQALLEAAPLIMNAILQALPLLVDCGMKLLTGLVQALPDILNVLISQLPTLTQLILQAVLTNLPLLIQAAVQLVTGVCEALPEIINQIIIMLPEIIGMICDALITSLPALIDGTTQLIILLAAHLPEICLALIEAIPLIIQRIGESIITYGPGLLTSLQTLGQTLLGYITQFGTTVSTNVSAFFTNFIANFKSWLSQLPEQIAYWCGMMVAKYVTFMYQLPAKATLALSQLINTIKSFGQKFMTEGAAMAKQFGEKLINGLKELPSKLLQVGKDIVEGLKNGIKQAWTDLTGWVGDLCNNLVKGFTDNLKIGSPSKVFRDEIGVWIPAGIAQGIEDGIGSINSAMADMTMAVSPVSMGSVQGYTPAATTPQDGEGSLYELLARYLPIIASGENVNVQLDVDGQRLFRVVQQQQARNTQLVGVNA